MGILILVVLLWYGGRYSTTELRRDGKFVADCQEKGPNAMKFRELRLNSRASRKDH